MKRGESELLTTVTILGSQTLVRPDGATALALMTKEAGTIAFVLSLETIGLLRKELADAESFLRQPLGKA